ncbi:condensation domain-containing protein [Streptomyces sp. NPDC057239]|uniref:condensation domain-containing protein n=1 Tax=Streptomyces sp. NPDC057239 TaxID=3346061 RepID=UPI0036455250
MTTDGHHPSDAPAPTPGHPPAPEPGAVTVTVVFAGSPEARQAVVHVHGPAPTGPLDTGTAPAAARLTGYATVSPAFAGPLADRLTRPPAPSPAPARTEPPETFAVTPLQRDVLADAVHHPDHHVEQLAWRWHGPLDTGRFTAAWQSVFDRETVLRAAFDWDPHPKVTVHRHATPEVVRHAHGTFPGRAVLMEHERVRGFDLRRPGLLRAALLDGAPPGTPGGTAPTEVLLTYHRALLDHWSVHALLREFYRAYCADGVLPGGERRPDLRDYVRWLEAQDPSAARDFWTREAARPAVRLPQAAPGAATGQTGTGRVRCRLTGDEAARLAAWAAHQGATESVAVHTVWAMLLHRASDAAAEPARVRFGVTVSGRGVFLGDIERTPGPFASPLPVSVEVDPAAPVSRLLGALRDCALDVSGYEWVAAGQIRDWLAQGPIAPQDEAGAVLADSLLVFEHRTRGLGEPGPGLAARGVRVDAPDLLPARPPVPIGIVVHHDRQGGLVLTCVHDRARLDDARAFALLSASARLLRELPDVTGESVTVADLLDGLPRTDLPRLHERPVPPAEAGGPLVTLRAATAPRTGTACLVTPPGTPASWLAGLVRGTTGAHAVVALYPAAHGARTCVTALRRHLRTADGPLVLAGVSGVGALACDIALGLAEDGGAPPPVVLADGDSVGALAHAIETTLRRAEAKLERPSRQQ